MGVSVDTIKYIEPSEARAIINSVQLVSRNPDQDTIFVELLWQTGGRVTEVVTMVPERIGTTSVVLNNLKQNKRDGGKTVHDSTAVKEVEISAALCNRLKNYCRANGIKQGEWIFKSPRHSKEGHMTRWYAWKLITKASEAGLVFKFGKRNPRTGGRYKGATPHNFRHGNAMKLLEETQDITVVASQLGHSDVRTTQRYAYVKRPHIKKIIQNIDWET